MNVLALLDCSSRPNLHTQHKYSSVETFRDMKIVWFTFDSCRLNILMKVKMTRTRRTRHAVQWKMSKIKNYQNFTSFFLCRFVVALLQCMSKLLSFIVVRPEFSSSERQLQFCSQFAYCFESGHASMMISIQNTENQWVDNEWGRKNEKKVNLPKI